eukprot:6188725-Prorocentrum_lima.AAC.1
MAARRVRLTSAEAPSRVSEYRTAMGSLRALGCPLGLSTQLPMLCCPSLVNCRACAVVGRKRLNA